MTIGSTDGKPWTEALPTERGTRFAGRTFSRFHIVGDDAAPTVGEIWATGEHAVEAHAHESQTPSGPLRGPTYGRGDVSSGSSPQAA
jgi:hypothetical protein